MSQESEFVQWADAELRRAGLFDADSDYEGAMGESVMKLVREFSAADHSGFSAAWAAQIFQRLASYKPLTPLTDDPSEWMHIDADMAGDATTWQSRRAPACFSTDGGRTYYDLDERVGRVRRVVARLTRRRAVRFHSSERAVPPFCEEETAA